MLDNRIHIVSICTSDVFGGAARAAYRIHTSVNALAAREQIPVKSTMYVKQKGTDDSSVCSWFNFCPQNKAFSICDKFIQKIRNQFQHLRWFPYRHTQDNAYKSDLRGVNLFGALRTLQPDMIHLHWINQRFIDLDELHRYVIREERCGHHIPIVWTLHDSWPFCGTCHYFLDCDRYQQQCGCCPQLRPDENTRFANDLSHRIWLRKSRAYRDLNLHIVSPSQWLADCAAESGLFKGRDIRVIPNCLDTDIFRPLSAIEIQNLAEQQQNMAIRHVLHEATSENKTVKPLILYGAMNAASDRIKGFASLLSALQILDKQGFEANLVVFGASETDLSLNFEHISVTFVGYVHDVNVLVNLYNVADVMVVPSYTEVFGQTASEAMACGTPVVAFRCTGIQDVVGAEGGYLAEPYSESDLAHGIEWVLEHNRHGEMREQVRKSAVDRFSIPLVAKQYVELYKELVK